jgi:hypothetical protein
MDIRANAERRRANYEREIHALTYEQTQHEKRIAEIASTLGELRGGVGEIVNLLRDLDTQAAIQAAEET